jgi:hypothetical protein
MEKQMKTPSSLIIQFSALIVCMCALNGAHAAVPLPGFVLIGQVLDEYGWPYAANANVEVTVRVAGRVCGRAAVRDSLAPGVNYVIDVSLDDGTGGVYSPSAAREGDQLDIRVTVDGVPQPIVQTSLPLAPEPAGTAYMKLTVGTDVDGDGLPDAWEQWMVDANPGDDIDDVGDITAAGDFDGDGASNLHEYLAGTFPDWGFDYFAIKEFLQTADGKLAFRFLTVPGKVYGIRSNAQPAAEGWKRCAFTVDPQGTPGVDTFEGNGRYMTIYITPENDNQVYRLTVK